MNLSPVTNLAWQLAAAEAGVAKSKEIEPEHFLAALTKLQQFFGGDAAERISRQARSVGEVLVQ